jgi:hypothetical protein
MERGSQQVEGCSWLRRAEGEWHAALNIRGSIVRLEDQEAQALKKGLEDHCASPKPITETSISSRRLR